MRRIIFVFLIFFVVFVQSRTIIRREGTALRIQREGTELRTFDEDCLLNEDCDDEDFVFTAREGNALAAKVYENYKPFTTDLLTQEWQLLLVHVKDLDGAAEMISDILKIGKAAFIAGAIMKGTVNPLALAYFVVKDLVSRSLGGTGGWIAQNFVGTALKKVMRICVGGGDCTSRTGALDCYYYEKRNPKPYVIPVGDASKIVSSTKLIGCAKGTCKANGMACNSGAKPLCVDGGITSLSKCICGFPVTKQSKLCYEAALGGKPTLGTVEG